MSLLCEISYYSFHTVCYCTHTHILFPFLSTFLLTPSIPLPFHFLPPSPFPSLPLPSLPSTFLLSTPPLHPTHPRHIRRYHPVSAHRSTSQELLLPVEVTSDDDSEDLPQHILAQMFAFISSDTNLEARGYALIEYHLGRSLIE